MKHLRFIYAAAAACALLASQPVLAAEQSFDTYGSAVITAGQGAAQENSAEVPGGGSETVHFYGPGGQNAGDSKTPNTVQNEQAPATESEGPASSPVITAGEADRDSSLFRTRQPGANRAGQKARREFLPESCSLQIRVWRRQRQSAVNRQRRLLAAWWIRQDLW